MKSVRLCKLDDLHNMKRDLHKLKLIVCTNLGKKVTGTKKGGKVGSAVLNPIGALLGLFGK